MTLYLILGFLSRHLSERAVVLARKVRSLTGDAQLGRWARDEHKRWWDG
jgi:hypothetical protein